MLLDANVDEVDSTTAVVSLIGPLTLGTNLQIAEARVRQLASQGFTRLVLDLSGCAYCDSAGLGMLVLLSGMLQSDNGMLRLCGVNDRIRELIKMTRTDSILHCDVDRNESLAAGA